MSSSKGKVVFRAVKSINLTAFASKFVKTNLKNDMTDYLENAQEIVDHGYVERDENLAGWKVWNNTRQNLEKLRRTIEGR